MNDKMETERAGWFVTAAGAVGDLGNPFYGEERRRDVWNEASAVGLQMVLLLGLAAATGMGWIGGESGVPYAMAVVLVLGVASCVSMIYAQKLGVGLSDGARITWWRTVPYLVLLIALLVGAVRVAPESGFRAGAAWGAVVGACVALLAVVWREFRVRRSPGDGQIE